MGMIHPRQDERQPAIPLGEVDISLEGCLSRRAVSLLLHVQGSKLVRIQPLGHNRAVPQIAVEVILLNRLRKEQRGAKQQSEHHNERDRSAQRRLDSAAQKGVHGQAIADEDAGVDRHEEHNGPLDMALAIDEGEAQPGQQAVQSDGPNAQHDEPAALTTHSPQDAASCASAACPRQRALRRPCRAEWGRGRNSPTHQTARRGRR